MNVKELIEILETCNPEHEVIIRYDTYAHRSVHCVTVVHGGTIIEAEDI